MTNEKLRLSVGASVGQRAFTVVFGLVFAAVGAAFVLLPTAADGLLDRLTGADRVLSASGDVSDLPPDLLPPELRDSSTGSGSGSGAARLIGLFGIPFVLLGLHMVLRVLRTAAWLDGTTARVRGAYGTRTVDLSRADITANVVTYRLDDEGMRGRARRIPTLVARDPDGGRAVTIPLQGMGLATLPPHELRAVADAMTAGRPTDGRSGDVHVIAGQLRTMAGNPLDL